MRTTEQLTPDFIAFTTNNVEKLDFVRSVMQPQRVPD